MPWPPKPCEFCGSPMNLRCERDLERKHFCSRSCRQRGRVARGEYAQLRVCEPGADPNGSYYERNRVTVLAREKQRYRSDPEYRDARKAAAQAQLERLREERAPYIEEARANGCIDCGWNEVTEVLEFDHVRGSKRFSPASAGVASLGAFLAELAKCEVRCPTCHRLRHHMEHLRRAVA